LSTQPQAPRPGWFDGEDAPTAPDLERCIHCGLCLTACPTYRTLKIEPDSPRGRLWLMRGLAEGRIEPDDPLVEHLDNCLDCRACETVCPAGVPYGRLLEATRAQIERRVRRPSALRTLGGWVLGSVLPHRERVHAAADVLRLGQVGALGAWLRGDGARWLPDFARRGMAMTPMLDPRAERALELVAARLPAGATMEARSDMLVFSPAGTPRGRVAFHTSCVMEPLFPHTHREAVRLLVIAGVQVRVPLAQTCCGALHSHGGRRELAKDLSRTNVRAFGEGADFIVSHSAGCGAALRETGELLEHDADAEAFGARVRDISEVLAHYGLPAPPAPMRSARDPGKPLRIAMHDPCHLAHAQRVREAPRRLLRQIPGVELVDLPDSDWCCGSAGVYNLTHPAMADAQLQGKLDRIERVDPEIVIASNPGCMLHMRRGAAERGNPVRMAHLLDILGEAYPAVLAGAPPHA
jgi:glycolate oxidase iron-sulfur subunit